MFSSQAQAPLFHRQWKPEIEIAPNCPRCDSSNTKFCYYNNYSLSQPRYFCKGCRRYWTKGGSLRNVPVGGGCRKNRRAKPVRQQSGQVQVRPDLVLDGMVGNGNPSSGSNQSGSSSSDGSSIDMAVLYNKYLNQPDGTITMSDSVNNLSDCVNPNFQFPSNDGLFEWNESNGDLIGDALLCNSSNILFGEMNYNLDSGCYESPKLQTEQGFNCGNYDENFYDSSCSIVPNFIHDGNNGILQEITSLGSGDWNALDCPSLESFYKC
ncbi:hypothetical protein LUZ60_001719 [Juncus effusus]|nr:hypothetical protein LUZ60_001719 [Juncus effusus]